MIEERIVVSDSNIFIDLFSVDLLDSFMRLPWELATTDFVMNEIKNPVQQKKLQECIETNGFHVEKLDAEDVMEVAALYAGRGNNVSMTDCSVWFYAKKVDGRLLTGDAKLRKSATEDHVRVSGLLYVLDSLLRYEIVDRCTLASKLEQLLLLNKRLPRTECEERILEWRNTTSMLQSSLSSSAVTLMNRSATF